MKTQHTPGPWIMKQNGVIRKGDKGTVIAEVTQSDQQLDITPQESESNARLIAAAPELLKALQDALATVSEAIRNEDIPLDLIPDKVLTKWEKAIAKATQP